VLTCDLTRHAREEVRVVLKGVAIPHQLLFENSERPGFVNEVARPLRHQKNEAIRLNNELRLCESVRKMLRVEFLKGPAVLSGKMIEPHVISIELRLDPRMSEEIPWPHDKS
jgi:hypothetical protein